MGKGPDQGDAFPRLVIQGAIRKQAEQDKKKNPVSSFLHVWPLHQSWLRGSCLVMNGNVKV